jgi:hypothetical protein
MSKLVPGTDGEPMPAGTLVFRIGNKADLNEEAIGQRKAPEIFFKPSSSDLESPGKRLSVWVEELTIADQGWAIMGSNPRKTVVVCLNVDDILKIEPPAPFHSLSTEWERALLADGTVNTHPGAEGHAGIAGLCQGHERNKTDKNLRKALRSRLADRAKISPVPVPHDISERNLCVAAYFIFEKDRESSGSREQHWVSAIRQLRRARVREQELAR